MPTNPIKKIHELEFHGFYFFFCGGDAQGFLASVGDKAWLAAGWLVEFFGFNHVHLDKVGMSGLGEIGGQLSGVCFDLIAGVQIIGDDDMAAWDVLGMEPEFPFFGHLKG